MALHDAMRQACAAVGILSPDTTPAPGRWRRTNTLERNGKGDASVLIFDDAQGGICWNWQTSQKQPFSIRGQGEAPQPRRRDPEKERRAAEEAAIVARTCSLIVSACRREPRPYLATKGFPDELGLVHDDPRVAVPGGRLGEAMASAMPDTDQPLLVVPGRIGKQITTVQFITVDGAKKNILRGRMAGSSHRIATGRQTVVCEGIATALSVRAALRLLGVSATVLSAFSASNVAAVARGIPGSFIAADHDKPIEALHGKGTGEFYAEQSGRAWTMPKNLGDYNDMHQSEGLRAVALHLREVMPP